MNTLANFLALASAAAFASSSLIWRRFAHVPPLWANAFKNAISLVGFAAAVLLFGNGFSLPTIDVLACLALSGVLGLTLADTFLIQSYWHIGPARTFVISSFQPLFLGILSYFFLGQGISWTQAIGILAMMGCVITLGFEVWKKDSLLGLSKLRFAALFFILDGGGLFFARLAFERTSSLSALDANLIRCVFAVFGFAVLTKIWPIDLIGNYRKLSTRQKYYAIGASLLGTFIGLLCRLEAISRGHLATVVAIAGSTPVLATCFEALLDRKWPNRYLWISLILFGIGTLTILRI